jgi:hypothetical protein
MDEPVEHTASPSAAVTSGHNPAVGKIPDFDRFVPLRRIACRRSGVPLGHRRARAEEAFSRNYQISGDLLRRQA